MSKYKKIEILRWTIFCICAIYVTYECYAYIGLFRFLADLSIQYIGTYENTLIGLIATTIYYIPLHYLSTIIYRSIYQDTLRGNPNITLEYTSPDLIDETETPDIASLQNKIKAQKLMKFFNTLILIGVLIGGIILMANSTIIKFWETIIYNPTDEIMHIAIDQTKYDIPRKTGIRVPISR